MKRHAAFQFVNTVRGPPFNLGGAGFWGWTKIFFSLWSSRYIFFFPAAWSLNCLFHFYFELFQLYLEGNYLFQHLAATNYLFYHLFALNYLFQKSPAPPPEIKWWPSNTVECCIRWDTRPQSLLQPQAWEGCVTRNSRTRYYKSQNESYKLLTWREPGQSKVLWTALIVTLKLVLGWQSSRSWTSRQAKRAESLLAMSNIQRLTVLFPMEPRSYTS